MNFLKKLPNNLFLFFIKIYQKVFSPSLGILRLLPFYPKPSCVFYPTCSEYAATCFQKYSFFSAFKKVVYRVSRCHSGTTPSVDLP